MKRLIARLLRVFRRRNRQDTVARRKGDYLPGELARYGKKDLTAQELAWRQVAARTGDRRFAATPPRSREFERLIRK